MTAHRGALPTLTEVIDVEAAALVPAAAPAVLPPESLPLESQPVARADHGAVLSTQVLETLRPRIDALLEAQLQTAMAPHLARLADELERHLRRELASAMQALVAQAVDEVLARRRKP
jgi:hypothetical protein